MVSRDNRIHYAALALAVLVISLATFFDVGVDGGLGSVAIWLLFNGLVFGGAHLYLALRGEGGMVPVRSRWRYLAVVTVVLAAGSLVAYGGEPSVAGVDLHLVAGVLVAGVVALYLVTEGLTGYRDSMGE